MDTCFTLSAKYKFKRGLFLVQSVPGDVCLDFGFELREIIFLSDLRLFW